MSQTAPLTLSAGFRRRLPERETPARADEIREAVARAQAGDREALSVLYVRYAHNIYGYVRSIVQDDHEAEDVTQQVFTKLMTALPKYDERGHPFLSWLLRLARNAAIDHIRRSRETPVQEVLDPLAQWERDLDRGLAVRAALGRLPDEQREVVFLRHVVGLTPLEIAGRMGRSEGSIHGLHHRGRRALQHELRGASATPSASRLRHGSAAAAPAPAGAAAA
jgi:RNA polymerase sigma-70 factor (ECF subfamily)